MNGDKALRQFIESAETPVGLFTMGQKILALSSPAISAWGLSGTEFVGANYYSLTHDHELEAATHPFHDEFHAGALSALMLYARLQNDYVAALWRPLKLEDGTSCTLVSRVDVPVGPEMLEAQQSVHFVPIYRTETELPALSR